MLYVGVADDLAHRRARAEVLAAACFKQGKTLAFVEALWRPGGLTRAALPWRAASVGPIYPEGRVEIA